MTDNNTEIDIDIEEWVSERVDARESVRTGLLCLSMVALGVAIGVNIFTAKMLVTLDLTTYLGTNEGVATLNGFYEMLMHYSLGIFAACSVAVVALDTGPIWARDG